MALLKFLFITVCILWLIRITARFLLPYFFHKMVNKVQNQANQRYEQSNKREPEGQIRVDYVPPKDKDAIAADKAGEFVDYEEVK